MTSKLLLTVLAFFALLQVIYCAATTPIYAEACKFPDENKEKLGTLSVETESATLSCKSCHAGECPHWRFDLKKSPEQIARLKEICKGKSICACSDVALALMTEESTQEEGNTLMNGLYERFSGNPQIINENPVGSNSRGTNINLFILQEILIIFIRISKS
jgi:hypothetical protein